MRIGSQFEDIQIICYMRSKDLQGKEVIETQTSTLTIPPGTASPALAAMMKGFIDHFLIPLGDLNAVPEAMRDQIERDIARFKLTSGAPRIES